MNDPIYLKIIYLDKNQGHGNARRKSMNECSNSLIALMDADDLCLKDRFKKQLDVFVSDSKVSVVGGLIAEFIDSPDKVTGIRVVPEKHDEIRQFMKKHCPMNQMTVMFRKEDVEAAGGYQDWFCEEDYYLWLRMFEKGFLFKNLQEILVNVRIGEAMASRRGGWRYFCSEAKLQVYMLKKNVISLPLFFYNVIIRFFGEVVAGNAIRKMLFSFLRTDAKKIYSGQLRSDQILNAKSIYPRFSVSMCVYGGDNAEWFDKALESVVNQTIKPSEIVLVVDGPIPNQIQNVIDKYKKICIT